MNYLIYSLQAGEQKKTVHIQGYVQFKAKGGIKLAKVKEYLSKKQEWGKVIHVEAQRGTAEEAKQYCIDGTKKNGKGKDTTIKYRVECSISHNHHVEGVDCPWVGRPMVWEFGEMEDVKSMHKGQGTRSDLQEVKMMIDGGATRQAVRDAYPDLWGKYKSIQEWFSEEEEKILVKPEPQDWHDDMESDKAALAMWDYLMNPAEARKALWVWSSAGRRGKSERLAYFMNEMDKKKRKYFFTNGGEVKDMIHLYAKEEVCPLVIFIDLPRDVQKGVPYGFIEALMGRKITSGKYEGVKRRLSGNPWIVVCANEPPAGHLISLDRFVCINVD